MSSLLVVRGYNIGVRYELGDLTKIGRSPENQIQLFDRAISRFHCQIERKNKRYYAIDGGSTYGTLINGRRIGERKQLAKHDALELGHTLMVFDAGFDVKNTRFGDTSIVLGGKDDAAAPTWASDIADLPRLEPTEDQTRLKSELGALLAHEGGELPETLENLMQLIARSFRAERAAILVWDPVEQDLIPLIALSPDEDNLPVSSTVIRQVMERRQAVLSQDVLFDRHFATALSIADQGRRSLLCVPVFINKQVAGVIYLDHGEPQAFQPNDAAMLQTAAHIIAPLVQKFTADPLAAAEAPAKTERLYLGESRQTHELLEMAERFAPHNTTILIQGETGVGKDVLARELHRLSPRKDYPFIALNCASIPETLFESELFGHEKGAFTGANALKRGKIEAAHGGTLFLDEIGEMSVNTQPKLLRFLQDRVFNRVGGNKPIHVDVRIIVATNRDLKRAVKEQRFRWDLLFRLNVVTLQIAPLRERREDVTVLARHLLKEFAANMRKSVFTFSHEALDALQRHDWPGNVRELANCVERAVLLCETDAIQRGDLLLTETRQPPGAPDAPVTPFDAGAGAAELLPLREVEKLHIRRALEQNAWNQVRAAEALQIHRNTLRRKIQEYELNPPKI